MNAIKVKLLVIQGRPQGKFLVFAPGSYYFGRGEECQVRPNSPLVSRQHCLLHVTEVGVYLRDLGSRHGTLVNGALIQNERQIHPGDQIQIGPLVFEMQVTLSETPAQPAVLDQPASPTSETFAGVPLADVDGLPSTEETRDQPTLDDSEE